MLCCSCRKTAVMYIIYIVYIYIICVYLFFSLGAYDSEKEKFGGHIIVRDGGQGRFSGIQLTKMGQKNVLGR